MREERRRNCREDFVVWPCEYSWDRSDWVWWGWCGKWWDWEVVKSFRKWMLSFCQCRGWYTERVCYVSYSPCIFLVSSSLFVTWHLRPTSRNLPHGRDNFENLILTRTPSLTWCSSWSTISRTIPLSKISWTSTVRCSEVRTRQKKRLFQQSRQPYTHTHTVVFIQYYFPGNTRLVFPLVLNCLSFNHPTGGEP
jgi:hypothetical protein